MLHEFLVALVGDVILSNRCGQVDAVVEITTPKDIVMRFKRLSLLVERIIIRMKHFSPSLSLSYILLGM